MKNLPDTATLFDHTRFVTLREALFERFDNQAADAEIDAQLDELLRHMQQQFAAEERAMEAAQFPPRAAHKKDHDNALARFEQRIAQWHAGRDREPMLDYIEAPLADWFVKHVNTRDYITARFLGGAREGYSGISPDCPGCG
ncbi:MAG: hypothetical protein A2Z95_06670 [Gallionellales bacterium GWA2_60_18]|nr:MAG: hypothetical protein A2Z95_06670 [Gallionellales bacterium GWA2_60_18]